MQDVNLKSLINELSDELQPVQPLKHPIIRALPFVLGVIAYVLFVVAIVGLRPDFFVKLRSLDFAFEVFVMLVVGVSAVFSSSWLCVPDRRGNNWIQFISPSLFACFILWMIWKSVREGVNMPAIHWDECIQEAVLLGALPAFALFIMSSRGKTTQPLFMTFLMFLSVSSLGYVGLRMTCMIDTVGHSCVLHFIPYVIAGGALALAARRIYRW